MNTRLVALALGALCLPTAAQTPCGLAGVSVTLTPEVAVEGEPILVTLTNNTSTAILLQSSCTYVSVHSNGSCEGPAVFTPFCAQVITSIPGGQSHSMLWDQRDNSGNQVPPGEFAFGIRYFDGSFGTALSCCPVATVIHVTGTPYCTSEAGVTCPCGNLGDPGEGCENSTGQGAILDATGDAIVGADSAQLSASQCPSNVTGMFFSGPGQLPGDPFGDGLRCVSGPIIRLGVVTTSATGEANSSGSLSVQEGLMPGDVRNYQFWYRDVTGPCNGGFNTSGGCRIQW